MPPVAVRRLQRELKSYQAEGVSPMVYVSPRGDDITAVDALIIGPVDTPYDGAMLHFRVQVPPDYPLKPPQVRFMTTDGGSLRLHPQLYADGKVCLSILGTWHGPTWSASLTIRTVLLSIQSLLNEEPLRCEPGLEGASQSQVELANVYVLHEAVRVGVIRPLEQVPSWGCSEEAAPLTEAMQRHLRLRREALHERLLSLAKNFDGQVMRVPSLFRDGSTSSRRYEFGKLAQKLAELLPPAGSGIVHTLSSPASAPQAGGEVSKSEAAPSASTAEDDADADDLLCCRICHQTAVESGQKLIKPCRCSGSIGLAHSQCLLSWLQHTGALAPAEWRCDVCRVGFRVRLAGGRPPGLLFLRKHLDVFNDRGFPYPGLVSILLLSLVQMFFTCLARAMAEVLAQIIRLLCKPFQLQESIATMLVAPAILIDNTAHAVYIVLVLLKVAMSLSGAAWRPADWGEMGEEVLLPLLGTMSDTLGIVIGLKLRGLMILTVYTSLGHTCNAVTGKSPLRFLAGDMLKPWLPKETLNVLSAVPVPASGGVLAILQKVQHWASCVSLVLNFAAILRLAKVAFVDPQPLPVEVLEAKSSALRHDGRRKDASSRTRS